MSAGSARKKERRGFLPLIQLMAHSTPKLKAVWRKKRKEKQRPPSLPTKPTNGPRKADGGEEGEKEASDYGMAAVQRSSRGKKKKEGPFSFAF